MSESGSSAQFEPFYQGPETPWRLDEPLETQYRVTAAESQFPESAPGASLKIMKPYTTYRSNPGVHDGYSARYPEDVQGDRVRIQRSDGPGGQMSLFDVEHHHPYVHHMVTHPDMRAHIPTMLGVAELETRARYGEGLRPSNDLSVHSSQLVRRLAEAGVTKVPSDEQRNGMSTGQYKRYEIPTRRASGYRFREVPDQTVQMGRQFIREVLRKPKQAVESTVAGVSEKKGVQQEMFN